MEIFQVDAFTDKAFAGNPAGVCVLSELKEDDWLQSVAGEMNLPETAFLLKKEDGFRLRWFTPEIEVDLCGHATLASAHVLWESGRLKKKEIAKFDTNSGILTAERNGKWIELNFPIEEEKETEAPAELIDSLGINPLYVGKNRFDYLIEVESEEIIKNLDPDFSLMKTVDARGIIVTSKSDFSRFDFVSRFFAPAIGVNEDPVTGSSHCCLGYYWEKRLGKSEFAARQLSKRGGTIRVKVSGDRIILGGQAITVLKGDLLYE